MTPHRRPRLALPFTILTGPDTVRLVAGEDFRYTLTAPGLDGWLPDCLARLDGRTPLDEALGRLPEALREPAEQLVEQLYGERVLIDGTAPDAHAPSRFRLAPAPELYDALAGGRSITPVPFPAAATAIVQQLLVWKAALAEEPEAPAALYRLHVLEVASLEVSSHRVLVDPECPECGGRN